MVSPSLQESAEEIVVLETNPLYQRQFEFVAQHRDTSRVRYLEESLFTAHSLGHFDVTLMLGLVYHFRHPQLFLDYCSHIECDRFVFSTQTRGGDDKHLWNRSQIPAYAGRGMLGWHPSKEAFKGMLEAASFRVDDEFQIRDPAFTNDYYVFCTRTGTVDVAVEPIIRIAHADSFWT